MNPAQFLAQFDRISDAPDAIPRLRRFILDLAVRGKLVEQDLRDEPASELLIRIRAQKERLVQSGAIKVQDPQPPITEDEIEYDLPTNWEPTRIGDLLTVIRGASPRPKGDPKYFSAERTPYHWIKISDIRKHSKNRVLYDTDEFLTEAGKEKSVLLPKDTLVVTNSATIGVPIFLGFEGGCIHDGYLAFPYFPSTELSKDFFFVLFQTLQAYAIRRARGMAQLNLNTGLVREFPLGLPPLAEQHRIVAKVDELMALCDRLEAAQAERESRRDRLAASSLNRLNNGADPDAFRDHARFYFNHLPRLTTRLEHIQQLRQTILNLAIQGRLVTQDPNDEPASELLKRIHAEQEELIKARVLKLGGEDSRLLKEDFPYDIPPTWQWSTLRSIIVFGPQNGLSPKPSTRPDAPRAITLTATTSGKFNPQHFKRVEATIPPESEFWLRSGDLLFQRGNTREYVGIAAYYTGEPRLFLYPDLMMKVRLSQKVSLRYVHLWSIAPPVREYFSTHATGAQATMPKINQGTLLQLPVPLPPLAEQLRIVDKVEELMALCDRLEAQLTTTHTESRRLLEALLHEALMGRKEHELVNR